MNKLLTHLTQKQKQLYNKAAQRMLLLVCMVVFTNVAFAGISPNSCSALGGTYVGSNLVGGGGFSVPGSLATNIPGATTDYTYKNDSSYVDGWENKGLYNPDAWEYVITSRTGPVHFGVNNSPYYEHWHDITGVNSASNPQDKFMAINANHIAGTVFKIPVNVEVNKQYEFSAYMLNLVLPTNTEAPLLPNNAFQYSTDGGASWQTIYETGVMPKTNSPQWIQQSAIFQAPLTGSILIRLRTNTPGGSGNDFAVDEIVFRECDLPSAPSPAEITGTVFEDINYGGGAGRDYSTANSASSPTAIGVSATVELWESNGTTCTGSAPVQSTISSTLDGSYTFSSVSGNFACIRVVNDSVQSKRTLIDGSINTIPVQTFRTESTDGSGTITAINNEVGGRSPLDVDVPAKAFDNSAGDGAVAQSWSVVNISGGDVSGIDFGFNFDTIVNTNDAGQGSLRQFIRNANALGNESSLAQSGQTAGREVSIFMLPNGATYNGMQASAGNVFSAGVATINLQSELPDILRSKVDIDATTQFKASCPTPILELNGTSAGSNTSNLVSNNGTSGISIRRPDHVIRGLIINRFASSGIELFRDNIPSTNDASDNTKIECNWIGLDRTGSSAQGNGEFGIALWGDKSFVGDGSDTGRNVISGNGMDGILNAGGGSLDNTIRGNYIGTDKNRTAAVGNGQHGIYYYNTEATTPGNQALVQSNTIAFNGGVGIGLANTGPSAHNVRIKQNAIHSNGELGIDLVSSGMDAPQGVTANDANDADSIHLPNGMHNFPVISSAIQLGSDVQISGTFNGVAEKKLRNRALFQSEL